MKLIVHELKTTLYTQLTPDFRVHRVYAIRPHLVRYGSPAGTVKVQIQDLQGELIAESASTTITDIGTGTYWHGYERFLVDAHLLPETEVRIALVPSGYSFSESAYLGWCNSFDLGKYSAGYTPSGGYFAPLDLEVWSYEHVKKGVV